MVEQVEGDARAFLASGHAERSPFEEREAFDAWLVSEPEQARVIPCEEMELRRALRLEA